MSFADARMNDLSMKLDINATPDAVWRALTSDIGGWWPAEFYAGGEAGKRRFVLEPEPGGRMCEAWDSGGGILWATVVAVEPGKRLQVVGYSFPNWGGPSQWFGTWELTPGDNATQLRFTENTLGRISEAYVRDKEKGWKFLWATLKAKVERKPLPAWED